MKTVLRIMILLFAAFYTNARATQVSGDVWGVWDSTMNPIEVVGELRVPPDSSLIIGPGCHIEFQGYYKFIIDTSAVLQAIGTHEDSIVFNSYHPAVWWYGIRFFSAADTCRFAYCVLEDGYAYALNPPNLSELAGGAVYGEYTDLEFRNCLFRNNHAPEWRGGAIYSESGNITIDSCEIIDNQCGMGGSGLYSTDGDVTITNSIFAGDTTWYPLGGEMGGAILCYSRSIYLYNNRFADNFSGTMGNIIDADTAIILANEFIGNESWSGGGGLIVNVNDTGYIADNQFIENAITYGFSGGAGLFVNGDNVNVLNNSFIGNNASFNAGGLRISGSNYLVANNIFAYNHANNDAGGIYISGTNISLVNNVIAYNSSHGAGGVYSDNSSPFTPITMINNIVWGNTAESWPQIYILHHPLDVSYCDVQGGWQGNGNIDIDPLFRDTANGDFHLMSTTCGDPYDSPCIDVGDPTIQDYLLNCDWGLGSQLSDMGAYGGGDSTLQDIEDYRPPLPQQPIILQNYPNPFNAVTSIEFHLSVDTEIELAVFNLLGQEITVLLDGPMSAGQHRVSWDPSAHPSGIYFARLVAGKNSKNIKMLLLK